MIFRGILVFILSALSLVYFNQTSADSKSDLIITENGIECRLPLIKPWQKIYAIFGFSTLLYQENKTDDRVTFGLVITPYSGQGFESSDFEKEISEFHQAKAEFIEELGGEFLGDSDSLLGEQASKIYRVSVNYRLDEIDYRDSTYFRYVNGRLVHSKVIFPLEKFDENTVEQQTIDLLAGMSCQDTSTK